MVATIFVGDKKDIIFIIKKDGVAIDLTDAVNGIDADMPNSLVSFIFTDGRVKPAPYITYVPTFDTDGTNGRIKIAQTTTDFTTTKIKTGQVYVYVRFARIAGSGTERTFKEVMNVEYDP